MNMSVDVLAAILSVGIAIISAVIIDGIKTRIRIGVIISQVDDNRTDIRDLKTWVIEHERNHNEVRRTRRGMS